MRTTTRKRELQIMRICRGLTEGPVRGPARPALPPPQPYPPTPSGSPLSPADLLTSQPLPSPALLFQREAMPVLEPTSPGSPELGSRQGSGGSQWQPALTAA